MKTPEKQHEKPDPLYSALLEIVQHVSNDQYERLCKEIDKQAKKYIKGGVIGDNPKNKDQTRAYHNWRHFLEMYSDANLAKSAASLLFKQNLNTNNQQALELYMKLLQCMHAAHDIVQESGPVKNEEESSQEFKKDFAKIIHDLKIKEKSTNMIEFMADQVIIDGTLFLFPDKKTKAVQDYMVTPIISARTQDEEIAQNSPLIQLAKLSASFNDTSRMLRLNEMLESTEHRQALAQQYLALKDNLLCKILGLKIESSPNLIGKELYQNMLSRLKKVNRTIKRDKLDSIPENKRLPLLAFMQIFGQNLRISCESNNQAEYKQISSIFANFIRSKEGNYLESELRDPKLVELGYNFIMEKMRAELKIPNGFCAGMKQSIEDKTSGFKALNDKFKDQNGVDIISKPYTKVWSEYLENATAILNDIELQASQQQDQIEFKLKFIIACADIARNQSGLFMDNELKLGLTRVQNIQLKNSCIKRQAKRLRSSSGGSS